VKKDPSFTVRTLASKYWLEATIGLLAVVVLIVGIIVSQQGRQDGSPASSVSVSGAPSSSVLLVLNGKPLVTLDSVAHGSVDRNMPYKQPFVVDVRSGETLTVRGWALGAAHEAPPRSFVQVDNFARVEGEMSNRPDVASALKSDVYLRTGYTFRIPPAALPVGNHRLAILLEDSAGRGYYVIPDWIDVVVERNGHR